MTIVDIAMYNYVYSMIKLATWAGNQGEVGKNVQKWLGLIELRKGIKS